MASEFLENQGREKIQSRERKIARKIRKQRQAQFDRVLQEKAQLRVKRNEALAGLLEPQHGKLLLMEAVDGGEDVEEEFELPKHCYTCKARFITPHFYYDRVCGC